MSMRYTSLKALQRPPRSAPAETTSYPPLLGDGDGISQHIARPKVERLAQVLGATTKTNQHGEFLSVRCWCAQPPSFSPDPRALKLLLPEAPEEIADPGEWLFLDTETTGLSGGSGTYPFLVGIAWWEGGGLEIEQLFMREYSEERSLLFALRERIAEYPVVVTFNGKSFDWPLLETRYRMTRKIAVPTLRLVRADDCARFDRLSDLRGCAIVGDVQILGQILARDRVSCPAGNLFNSAGRFRVFIFVSADAVHEHGPEQAAGNCKICEAKLNEFVILGLERP